MPEAPEPPEEAHDKVKGALRDAGLLTAQEAD
jgi:hypothetical protein